MTRWAGIAKLQEEMCELGVELAKLHAKPDGKHWDNSRKEPLIQCVKNELADVTAALIFFTQVNFTDAEHKEIIARADAKIIKFMEWHRNEGMTGTKDD